MDSQQTYNTSQLSSGDITFLPVNQPGTPDSQRARRGYQSCDNCREKKKRCEPSVEGGSCGRCHLESRECLTTYKRKRRKMRPLAGGTAFIASGKAQSQETPEMDQRPDSHSDIDPPVEGEHNGMSQVASFAGFSRLNRTLNTKEQILSTNLLDARDALDLIAVAGSTDATEEVSLSLQGQHPNQGQMVAATAHIRPALASVSTAWSQFFLVRRGIIRTNEAIEYLDFYFSHLWQLFPVVSQWYSSPDRYELLAVEEPVLTISLITIASRYHPLTGFNGHARSERIHWRTWPWVQRLLQSSIWGSSAMRRLGSIASLLLFIEWHPRAINSPEDLVSDVDDMKLFHSHNTVDRMGSNRLSDSSSSSMSERLNIVAPAYRSNKMSWMLLSTAIALAQEQGCFEEEPVLRSHTPPRGISSTSDSSNPVWQEWSRIVCAFLRLTDEALALRLRLEPQLGSTSWTELVYRLPPSLTADGILESAVDLATHMRKARELLLAWRKSEQGTGPAVSLAMWNSFKRRLDRWERQRQCSRPDSSLRGTFLDIEYYYVRLCGLSPAAHMFEKTTESCHTPDVYTSSLSPFAEAATNAAIDMLELTTRYFATPTSSLSFRLAPVRCWLYTFCAALYLLKATLRTEKPITRTHPNINLILQVVNGIKYNAPDDLHMSQRYAELLEILINTALRPSATNYYANNSNMSGGDGGSNRRGSDNHSSPNQVGEDTLPNGGNPLGVGDEWIYDSSLWEALPDMVGLNSIPGLVFPCYE